MQTLPNESPAKILFPSNGFRPPAVLKNPTLQTVLSSSSLRKRNAGVLRRSSTACILEVEGGVRLLGLYSEPRRRDVAGIAVLLHGWEGSADSTYIVRTGQRLLDGGFAVMRLNFRDHGDSHSLNENIFFATALDEVFGAVRKAAQRLAHHPACLIGFSLGGNFALRIARRCLDQPIDNLVQVVAVSPVLDPAKSTDRVDRIDYVRRYFLHKWRRSLKRKKSLYPHRFGFADLDRVHSVRGITEMLLQRYSDFNSAEEYFSGYNLCGDALKNIGVPAVVLSSADDPIIPIEDFRRLSTSPSLHISLQQHGGHNGFIEHLSLRSWYEFRIVELLRRRSFNPHRER